MGNGRILREGPFTGLWVQPAAGDAGGAIGAALLAWHRLEARRSQDGAAGGRHARRVFGPGLFEC